MPQKSLPSRTVILLTLLTITFPTRAARAEENNWPEFRGPTQQGHAPASSNPPLRWFESPERTENIRYKVEIPGRGWSSPVIWDNQIWLTTATDEGHSLRALCLDKSTGVIQHNIEVFHVENPDHINPFNSYASPTPVIEQGRLYVCFGAAGSACIDTTTAKLVWQSQDLKINHFEGAGSSPTLYKNLYLLNCDGADRQFVAALDKSTGQLAWRTDRTTPFPPTIHPSYRKAFSTPLIINVDGADQLISPAARRIYAYAPLTGRELWHVNLEGLAYNNAPRPIFASGILYISTGYERAQLWAIRVDAKSTGDVTDTHVLWKYPRGPLKPSPLIIDNQIYFVSDDGIARALDAATGTELWHARIGNAFSASPIYAQGRLYFVGEGGRSIVCAATKQFKLLADDFLQDGALATPAVSANSLYLRTKSHLYRLEQ